jgi:hypothetical protein
MARRSSIGGVQWVGGVGRPVRLGLGRRRRISGEALSEVKGQKST